MRARDLTVIVLAVLSVLVILPFVGMWTMMGPRMMGLGMMGWRIPA